MIETNVKFIVNVVYRPFYRASGIVPRLINFFSFSDFDNSMYWIGGNDLATHQRWVWASKGYRIYPYVNWETDKVVIETPVMLSLSYALIFLIFEIFPNS